MLRLLMSRRTFVLNLLMFFREELFNSIGGFLNFSYAQHVCCMTRIKGDFWGVQALLQQLVPGIASKSV